MAIQRRLDVFTCVPKSHLNKLRRISFLRRVVHQSQYKAVKYCFFIIGNLCDKSGEATCIESRLINFTPKLGGFTKQSTLP